MAARIAEGKPWEPLNSDGSLNLGSYEVLAAAGTTELAHELMLARAVEAGHDVFSLDTMRRLARTLLGVADAVQATVRSDGRSDRMDASHTRARGAVRTALEAYPVPWDASADEKSAWVADLTSRAVAILGCSIELSQEPAPAVLLRRTPATVSYPSVKMGQAS